MYKCTDCGSEDTRLMAQMTVSFPSTMAHDLTATNRRSKKFRVMGVNWDAATVICNSCGYVSNGFGDYITRLRAAAEDARSMLTKREYQVFGSPKPAEVLAKLTAVLDGKS